MALLSNELAEGQVGREWPRGERKRPPSGRERPRLRLQPEPQPGLKPEARAEAIDEAEAAEANGNTASSWQRLSLSLEPPPLSLVAVASKFIEPLAHLRLPPRAERGAPTGALAGPPGGVMEHARRAPPRGPPAGRQSRRRAPRPETAPAQCRPSGPRRRCKALVSPPKHFRTAPKATARGLLSGPDQLAGSEAGHKSIWSRHKRASSRDNHTSSPK